MYSQSVGQSSSKGKKEISREELLENVRSERAQRTEQKQKNKSAILIQKTVRRWLCARKIGQRIDDYVVQKYSAIAGDTTAYLTAREVAGDLLPKVLLLNRLRGTGALCKSLKSAEKGSAGADQCMRAVIAILLRSTTCTTVNNNYTSLTLDQATPFSEYTNFEGQQINIAVQQCDQDFTTQPRESQQAHPFDDEHASDKAGSSSASIDSPKSTSDSDVTNCSDHISLNTPKDTPTKAPRPGPVLQGASVWRCQSRRLIDLCCRLLDNEDIDQALVLGTTRLVQVLLDEACWKWFVPSTVPTKSGGTQPSSSQSISQQQQNEIEQSVRQLRVDCGASGLVFHALKAVSKHFKQDETTHTPSSIPQIQMVRSCGHVLTSCCGVQPGSGSLTTENSGTATTGNAHGLSVEYVACASAWLQGLVCVGASGSCLHSAAIKELRAAGVLGITLQILMVQFPGKQDADVEKQKQQQQQGQAKGARGGMQQVRDIFNSSESSWYAILNLIYMGVEGGMWDDVGLLTQLLVVLQRLFKQVQYEVLPQQLLPYASSCIEPLTNQTTLIRHIAALQDKQEQSNGLYKLISVYHSLLLALDAYDTQTPQLHQRQRKQTPEQLQGSTLYNKLANVIAFNNSLLLHIWSQLMCMQGMVAIPSQNNHHWTVPGVSNGCWSLSRTQLVLLGLFCCCYSRLVQAQDDAEVYQEQKPFSISTITQITATFHTLLLHSLKPLPTPPTKPTSQHMYTLSLLHKHLPAFLRQIYERHARRTLVPPALWLAPFHAATANNLYIDAKSAQWSAGRLGDVVQQYKQCMERGGEYNDSTMSMSWWGHGGGPVAATARLLVMSPQSVPYESRVEVFRRLVEAERESMGNNAVQIRINRASVMEDALVQLGGMGPEAKEQLYVQFIDIHGNVEPGLDYGGLTKELLEVVTKAGFRSGYGVMSSNADGQAYPARGATILPHGLQILRLLGIVLGKALYEGMLLDIPLAPFFIRHIQGRSNLFDDLQTLDAELHKHLVTVKRYEGDVSDLCLDFTVTEDAFGKTLVHKLVPFGDRVYVDNSNRLLYCHLVADWHLNKRLGTACASFVDGLCQVIPQSWLRLFSTSELNEVLGGGSQEHVHVQDLKQYTTYSGGYSLTNSTIRMFWKIVEGMDSVQRAALLKFVTAASRPPLGGFQHLRPPFCIHRVPCDASVAAYVGGKDVDRLPSASTCYNMLKLPNYRRSSTMREKLLQAIQSGAGFDMS